MRWCNGRRLHGASIHPRPSQDGTQLLVLHFIDEQRTGAHPNANQSRASFEDLCGTEEGQGEGRATEGGEEGRSGEGKMTVAASVRPLRHSHEEEIVQRKGNG